MRTAALIWLLGFVALAGCVEREFVITTEPPGALVYISDVEVGRTPVSHPFTWYGDYEVIVRLDGYETIKTHAEINPPWYELPPVDLLSEIAPWTYHDTRYLHYKLQELQLPSDKELIRRAEVMEQRNAEPVDP